jgi:hypothetical protein
MVQVLAAKDNAKAAWDTIKTMCVGVDRIREARRQRLCKEFDQLALKAGENVEDFLLHVSSIVTEMQSLGDTTSELDGVQKILRVIPKRYGQMACSIETLLDLKELSIEELSNRLAASEGRGEPKQDASGALYLTEEEWRARSKSHQPGSGGSSSGGKQHKDRPSGGKDGVRGSGASKDDKCCYCGKRATGLVNAARRREARRRRLISCRTRMTLILPCSWPCGSLTTSSTLLHRHTGSVSTSMRSAPTWNSDANRTTPTQCGSWTLVRPTT